MLPRRVFFLSPRGSAMNDNSQRRRLILLGIAFAGMLAAYVPWGYMCVRIGIELPFRVLFLGSKTDWLGVRDPTGFQMQLVRILMVWWLLATVASNLLILASFLAPGRVDVFWQRRWFKILVLLGQVSWASEAYEMYVFYLWVVFSALLYAVTPIPGFSWIALGKRVAAKESG